MAISDKLTYLNETKTQLKNTINYTGASITDDTFRQYPRKLYTQYLGILKNPDTLFNGMPKVPEQTGTELSLNDTANTRMQLELNPSELTQETTPTPDNPSEVQVIKGNNSINIENKNLYDPTFRRTGTNDIFVHNVIASENNGVFKLITTGTDGYIWEVRQSGREYIQDAGKLYKINGDYSVTISNPLFTKNFVTFYNENLVSLGYYQFYSNKFNINLADLPSTYANAKYFTIRFGYGSSTTGETYTFTIQLEQGTTATNYVAHQEQVLPLNLPNGMEYCKIGDYEDEFEHDGDKWYLNKYIGKYTFTGNETPNAITGGYFYSSNIFGAYIIGGYNTKFKFINDSRIQGNDGAMIVLSNNQMCFRLGNIKDRLYIKTQLSESDLKSTIANTPLYYVLSTPTHEEITDTTLISQLNAIEQVVSYYGQTNISQTNTGLPFRIKASAIKNLESVFN